LKHEDDPGRQQHGQQDENEEVFSPCAMKREIIEVAAYVSVDSSAFGTGSASLGALAFAL
jgi:hypothetical protein